MTPHELKSLHVRLTEAETEQRACRQKVADAQRAEAEMSRKAAAIRKQIDDAKESSEMPTITEHAMLRFLQRVYGIDLDTVREILLTEHMVSLINTMKTGKFPVEGYDCVAVVKGRTIITIED